jgi:hypothetical protein
MTHNRESPDLPGRFTLFCHAELDRAPYGIITAPDVHGLRIEYADVSARAMIEERIRTGPVPDAPIIDV